MRNSSPDVVEVCRVDEIEIECLREFHLAGASFCLWLSRDRSVTAFSSDCTHRHCPLVDGEIEDGVIMCPCHGAEFDTSTGAVLMGPAILPLPIYRAWIVDDVIYVDLCPTA